MLWPSRHLNTATKLHPPYWTLTKHAGSHAAQCGKVKVAILNPAPKSVPCHFQLAPGSVREQLRSSNLGYHNLCKAPNQPPISSFKIFTYTMHTTASVCPSSHTASLFYAKHEQPWAEACGKPEVDAIFLLLPV